VTDYCREYINTDWDIKKNIKVVEKAKIFAENTHKLKDAGYCVPKVAFQWDDSPPLPRYNKYQCPTYSCNNTGLDASTCAYSVNKFYEYGTNITVFLNKNSCKTTQNCTYELPSTQTNWTVNSTCQDIPTPTDRIAAYPGEKCTSHDMCSKINGEHFGTETGYCIDGLCSGIKENGNCTSHKHCLAGTFCNGLRCEKQQPERGFCLDKFSCLNNLGCLNNTCVQMYSQKNGTYLEENKAEPTLCEFGFLTTTDQKQQCAQLRYLNESLADSKGFMKCTFNEMCNYTTGFHHKNGSLEIYQKPCECGYNSIGQAYCPLAHSSNPDAWRNYFKGQAPNDKCHTLSRGQCTEQDASQKNAAADLKMKTETAHLFYGAVDCAVQVLSASIIKTGLVTLVVLIALIF